MFSETYVACDTCFRGQNPNLYASSLLVYSFMCTVSMYVLLYYI